jgi:hypothetical protein
MYTPLFVAIHCFISSMFFMYIHNPPTSHSSSRPSFPSFLHPSSRGERRVQQTACVFPVFACKLCSSSTNGLLAFFPFSKMGVTNVERRRTE